MVYDPHGNWYLDPPIGRKFQVKDLSIQNLQRWYLRESCLQWIPPSKGSRPSVSIDHDKEINLLIYINGMDVYYSGNMSLIPGP
jgi:hypothetical protein